MDCSFLLLLFFAILVLEFPGLRSVEGPCQSECAIVRICRSNVLKCASSSLQNMSVLSTVLCSRNMNVFSIWTQSLDTEVRFLDPDTLPTLLREGMQTAIFGLGVSDLSGPLGLPLAGKVPPVITLIFNSFFLRRMEPKTFQIANVDVSFFRSSDLVLDQARLKRQKVVPPVRHCDSKYPPCLCKNLYLNMSNYLLDQFLIVANESSGAVCRKHFSSSPCLLDSCKIPDRQRYAKELADFKKRGSPSVDYCSFSSNPGPSILIFLLLLLPLLLSSSSL